MNSYAYSPKNNAFYALALKEDYLASDDWPEDAEEITDEVYTSMMVGQAAGKAIAPGEDGMPTLIDQPEPTQEDLILEAEQKKTALMATANAAISPLQDSVDLDMATDEEAVQLQEWKKYRVLLNRVDTSTAPDIVWPVPPSQR